MTKYSKTAVLLHWTIAILVVTNFVLVNMAEGLQGPARGAYMNPHKAIGVSILMLSLFRLFWRLGHKPPPMPNAVSGWQARLGKAVHAIFYFLIIAVPLSGWIMSSAHPQAPPVSFFDLLDVTLPLAKNEVTADWSRGTHEILTKPLFILILLHVVGALKHQFADRVPFIQRMWP